MPRGQPADGSGSAGLYRLDRVEGGRIPVMPLPPIRRIRQAITCHRANEDGVTELICNGLTCYLGKNLSRFVAHLSATHRERRTRRPPTRPFLSVTQLIPLIDSARCTNTSETDLNLRAALLSGTGHHSAHAAALIALKIKQDLAGLAIRPGPETSRSHSHTGYSVCFHDPQRSCMLICVRRSTAGAIRRARPPSHDRANTDRR